jgi:CheY-like chemotaxis protein
MERTGRIFIIDDDLDIQASMIEVLQAENYEVLSAYNGSQALSVLKQLPAPAMILLDQSMPFLGGRDFLKVRNEDPKLANVPVIMISALAEQESFPGAQGILQKPFSADQLLNMVRKHTASA